VRNPLSLQELKGIEERSCPDIHDTLYRSGGNTLAEYKSAAANAKLVAPTTVEGGVVEAATAVSSGSASSASSATTSASTTAASKGAASRYGLDALAVLGAGVLGFGMM
jgi:hypothetical protein